MPRLIEEARRRRFANLKPLRTKDEYREAPRSLSGKTTDVAATTFGIGRATVTRAKRIVEAVKAGELPATTMDDIRSGKTTVGCARSGRSNFPRRYLPSGRGN